MPIPIKYNIRTRTIIALTKDQRFLVGGEGVAGGLDPLRSRSHTSTIERYRKSIGQVITNNHVN